jgi:hypothetical protein
MMASVFSIDAAFKSYLTVKLSINGADAILSTFGDHFDRRQIQLRPQLAYVLVTKSS